MRYTKLTVLGLCAMLVGLMALGASAAQAEKDNAWVILTSGGVKELVTSALKPLLEAQLEAETIGVLHADVLEESVHVEVRCTAGALAGVRLEGEGTLSNSGKVTFTGCKVWLNGEESPECKVHAPTGSPIGTVTTNELKGLLKLHESKHTILVEPKTGEILATLLMGAECVIGEEVPVEGHLALKDCEGKAEEHLTTHLIEELATLTLLHVLDDSSANVLGSALARLAGTHAGLKWASEPATQPGPPRWLVVNKGGEALDASELSATVGGAALSEELSLSATIGSSAVKVKCTAITLLSFKLAKEGTLTSGAKVRFTGCSVEIKEKAALECEVHSKGALVGTIETNALKGTLVKGKEQLKIEPESSETLVGLRLGEFCPVGEEIVVKGTVYVVESNGEATVKLTNHPLKGDAETAVTASDASATLKGEALAFLTGEHLNRTWSAET